MNYLSRLSPYLYPTPQPLPLLVWDNVGVGPAGGPNVDWVRCAAAIFIYNNNTTTVVTTDMKSLSGVIIIMQPVVYNILHTLNVQGDCVKGEQNYKRFPK